MRTSLKSSKGWRKYQKTAKDGEESESDEGAVNRLVDSGDESDDFYDRTDRNKLLNNGAELKSSLAQRVGNDEQETPQTYAQLKS